MMMPAGVRPQAWHRMIEELAMRTRLEDDEKESGELSP
jgi:hypothetical protein